MFGIPIAVLILVALIWSLEARESEKQASRDQSWKAAWSDAQSEKEQIDYRQL